MLISVKCCLPPAYLSQRSRNFTTVSQAERCIKGEPTDDSLHEFEDNAVPSHTALDQSGGPAFCEGSHVPILFWQKMEKLACARSLMKLAAELSRLFRMQP